MSVLTYGCESWNLKAESERRIAAFEMTFFRRISYRDHITNISVMQTITQAAGPEEPLLATVKRRNFQWFGHATGHSTLAKAILQGTVKSGRKRGKSHTKCTWTTLESGRVWSHGNYAMLLTTVPDGERSLWKPPSAHPYDRPGQWMNE